MKHTDIPLSPELARAVEFARAEVGKRAVLSAGATLVPVPGLDVVVDAGSLVTMMNAINRAFCLSPEQIEQLDIDGRTAVYKALSDVGAVFAGKYVYTGLAMTALKQLGLRWAGAKTARWIPVVGQGAAAALSYTAVKYLGEAHIRECVAVRDRITGLLPPPEH